jgi:two-component system osmolarity sensor histidine kinase EnvZ
VKLIKKIIPKSLFNRFLLIVLIPVIIVQITAIYVFYYNHVNNVNKHMSGSMSEQIYVIYQLHQTDYSAKKLDKILDRMDIRTKIIPDKKISYKYYNYQIPKFLGFINLFPIVDSFTYLRISLESKNIQLFTIYPSDNKNRVILDIQIGGDILRLDLPKKRIITTRREVFIAWLIMTSAITSLISILFIRNQIRSIKDLRRNAEKLGMGMDVVHFKINGALEIRSLAISLIRMKERIKRHINQRTLMLSGVSHDLRTLLARMKLQIALMEKNNNTINLEKDITDMQTMINEYLDFSKISYSENNQKIFVKSYFDELINSYRFLHKNINYNNRVGSKITLGCKSNNLKRAIRNIIDNAIKYANNQIYISIRKSKNNIIIKIDDDGIGVDKKKLEEIFKPFYRLDSSRNLDIIGTGLGLSISKDIIISHGGQISASRSSYQGLCVKIILPI